MELLSLRERIDEIDGEILRLFRDRMSVSGEVAQYKEKNGMAVLNRQREREVLARVSHEAGEELEGYARMLFSTMFDLSRSYQTRILNKESQLGKAIEKALENTPAMFPQSAVVACQGLEGAYSQIACDKLFPAANILYFKNFEGVFSAVEKGLCPYGVLPIENSLFGTVNEVYDLMGRYSFHIIRSTKLSIHHALLARPGAELKNIKEIVSHEQALGQCQKFLKDMPDVKITVCENTAIAAKLVAQSGRDDLAAISSRECTAIYGLNILADDIQSNANNQTRFICIAKDLMIFPGASKISLIVTAPHTPGSLYSLISKFAAMGVNLTKLESRPIPGRDFEFLFYFDLDASVCTPGMTALLGELDAGPEQFTFLGSYTEI